ncbi:peptidylprolyl isomerase [Halarcobacter ebronensis]|uniref:Peptidyl-prolyl cis-trans isomerase C n=1 Tax=Halarcobacter ebronensis TaxID=1462615 RepID=A0A4V1M0G5_9BACT|nr:peptidylprolyl isomerase [Halarcobacter ebronensis]QKF81594.1 peptidyl-prolyl cis-trans isomerase C [Halarcobacter ebronensis]RXJ68138.1 peptidylprolyl isomerase [Halarcobacter ebronensis]RXK05522.1 peptidylprolyl isomerase [Halarcobacter ebronensis]
MARAAARHLLVPTVEQCNELKTRIENGEKFEDLAKEYSQCPSGMNGGDLGVFHKGEMVPEFDTVVFNEAINTVHGPVKTQFGYHLLETTYRED